MDKRDIKIDELQTHLKLVQHNLEMKPTPEYASWQESLLEEYKTVDKLMCELFEDEEGLDSPKELKQEMANVIARNVYPDLDPPIDISGHDKIQNAVNAIFLVVAPYLDFKGVI